MLRDCVFSAAFVGFQRSLDGLTMVKLVNDMANLLYTALKLYGTC